MKIVLVLDVILCLWPRYVVPYEEQNQESPSRYLGMEFYAPVMTVLCVQLGIGIHSILYTLYAYLGEKYKI